MASNTGKDVEAGFSDIPPPAYDPNAGTPIVSDSHPPSYTEASADMGAPPPSYESLYGKLKAAKATSSGNVELGKNVCTIIIGTLGFTIFLAILLAIPIAMIAIGAVYKDDCPAERFIPIYLIVGGVFGIIKNISSLGQRAKNKDDEDKDEKNAKTNPFDGLIGCFLFAWFIAGNVWVYRTYNNFSTDPTAANYCHPTLYYFAFWIITATYIVCGLMCCCICCGGILAACCGAFSSKE